jgi:hypothetical protein
MASATWRMGRAQVRTNEYIDLADLELEAPSLPIAFHHKKRPCTSACGGACTGVPY